MSSAVLGGPEPASPAPSTLGETGVFDTATAPDSSLSEVSPVTPTAEEDAFVSRLRTPLVVQLDLQLGQRCVGGSLGRAPGLTELASLAGLGSVVVAEVVAPGAVLGSAFSSGQDLPSWRSFSSPATTAAVGCLAHLRSFLVFLVLILDMTSRAKLNSIESMGSGLSWWRSKMAATWSTTTALRQRPPHAPGAPHNDVLGRGVGKVCTSVEARPAAASLARSARSGSESGSAWSPHIGRGRYRCRRSGQGGQSGGHSRVPGSGDDHCLSGLRRHEAGETPPLTVWSPVAVAVADADRPEGQKRPNRIKANCDHDKQRLVGNKRHALFPGSTNHPTRRRLAPPTASSS
jgi:hypothetical protein